MAGQSRESLARALENPEASSRQLALIALSDEVEPDLLEPLMGAAADPDPAVRRLALGLLEELGDPRALPAIVAGLADEDEGVCDAARSAVREFRGPEAAAQLLAAARHPQAEVRAWVLVGLREIKDPRALPVLLEALGDPSAEVRRAAVVTLAHLKSIDTRPALASRLSDEDAGVRRLAVAALGRAGSPAPAREVIPLLEDEDWQVRAEAAAALGVVTEAGAALARATRDSHWQVVKAAAASLGALRAPEAATDTLPLLESTVPDVRRAAARALGEVRAAAATPRLRALLADADVEVRKAAERALEALATGLVALSLLVLAALVAGCKSDGGARGTEETTIRVAIGTQDTTINCATGGLVIREEHLLERYLPKDGKYAHVHWDVVWKDFPTGMTLTSEMIGGKLDFGSMGDFPSVLNAVAFKKQGQKTLYVSTLSASPTGAGNGLLVPTDSPAQSLADLKGKQISVPFGSASHGMLLRAVRDLGWDPEKDVTIVAQAPEVGGSSLKAGKIDGHADFVPFAELFPFRGIARKILDGSTVGIPTSHGTLVNAAYAAQYPEVVVALLKAEIEADRLVTADPEKYSRLIEHVSGVEAEVAYMFHGPLGIQTRDFTIKPEVKKGLQVAVETLKLLKKTDTDLDVDAFVDDRFIRQAAREMGVDYDARLASYEKNPLTTPDARTGVPITDAHQAAQLWVEGEDRVRAYASPESAFEAYVEAEKGGRKVRAVYVHDHDTGLALLGKTAWYVSQRGALSAFLLRKDAEAFAKSHGGAVVPFDEAKGKTWAREEATSAPRTLVRAASVVLCIGLWHLLATRHADLGLVNFRNVPSPGEVGEAVWALAHSPKLALHLRNSLLRVSAGFLLASITGVGAGLVIGRSRLAEDALLPPLELLRPIPGVAWIPLAILMFPSSELSMVFITYMGALFPILLNTIHGVEGVEDRLVATSRSLGAGSWSVLSEVIVPGALPSIVTGLSIGMGTSWFCLVTAEMIAGQYGIGYYTWESYNLQDYPGIVVGMVFIGAFGMATSWLVKRAGGWLMPWYRLEERTS